MSDDDCALINTISTIPPPGLMLVQQPIDVPWTVSMAVDNQGGSSLRSGDTDHSEASCLVLGVTLPADTIVRFSLRTSSQGLFDHLTFAANSQTVIENFSAAEGGGLRSWEQQEYNATNRISNLSWCYQKNGNTEQFADAGWLDTLSFAVPFSLSVAQLCAALDLNNTICARAVRSVSFEPPNLPWLISSTATQGSTSLRSGDIGDNEQSCLVLTLSSSSNRPDLQFLTLLQFSRRVSSQPVADRLFVSLNGNELNYPLRPEADTVLRDWSHELHFLPAGDAVVRWCYAKDGSTSQGDDSVWIDNLSVLRAEIVPLDREAACLALDMSIEDCTRITSVTSDPSFFLWYAADLAATEGNLSLRNIYNAGVGEQANCLVLGITLPARRAVRFSLRIDLATVNSETVNAYLSFEVDGQRLIDRFTAMAGETLRDWEPQQFLLPAGDSTLRWCYTRNSSTDTGEDRGWLDALSFMPVPLSVAQLCAALDMSTDNCSQIQSVSFEPPDFQWQITTDTSVAGPSSLRSGTIGDSEQSCLVLELALSPNSVISLASRASSQGGFDQLQISADQLRLDTLSAAISTTEKPLGPHNLLSEYYCHSTALVLCQGQHRQFRPGQCLDRQPEFQRIGYFVSKPHLRCAGSGGDNLLDGDPHQIWFAQPAVGHYFTDLCIGRDFPAQFLYPQLWLQLSATVYTTASRYSDPLFTAHQCNPCE